MFISIGKFINNMLLFVEGHFHIFLCAYAKKVVCPSTIIPTSRTDLYSFRSWTFFSLEFLQQYLYEERKYNHTYLFNSWIFLSPVGTLLVYFIAMNVQLDDQKFLALIPKAETQTEPPPTKQSREKKFIITVFITFICLNRAFEFLSKLFNSIKSDLTSLFITPSLDSY